MEGLCGKRHLQGHRGQCDTRRGRPAKQGPTAPWDAQVAALAGRLRAVLGNHPGAAPVGADTHRPASGLGRLRPGLWFL